MCCTAVTALIKSRIRRISQCYLQLLGASNKPYEGLAYTAGEVGVLMFLITETGVHLQSKAVILYQ